MSLISQNGIALEGSTASNNQIYSNIFQQDTIGITLTASSTSNIVFNNIITSNSIGLHVESSGNLVYANMIQQNYLAMNMMNSNDNKLYHNNFVGNNIALSISASTSNVWDDGYPSGGNFWSCHVSNDSFSGVHQDVPGSDGIVDVPYAVVTDNVDNYPLVNPFSIHNIGITKLVKSKTVVGQSYPLRVNLTIQNFGMYDEAFVLTICANTTVLDRQTVDLKTRKFGIVVFMWDTTGFAKGNYTVDVSIDMVAGEIESADNVLCCRIVVSIPGDINGDFTVNILDAITLSNSFLTPPSGTNWNPDADINSDNIVNILDAIILSNHFLQHYP
jgi:parallel beta-helix repeat protein